MSPNRIGLVAIDVLREALFSRYLVVLFGFILLCLISLAMSLDLEVIDGALAGGKLFGTDIVQGQPMMASEALRPAFEALGAATFVFGTLFLIVAIADIAPKMFAAGRVEFYLSLPLTRTELVLGTYVGVMAIAVMALALSVGGASAVLFVKAEVFTPVPMLAACAGVLAFAMLYALMLAVASIARSAALSAAAALLMFGVGLVTSDRIWLLSFIRSGFTREALGFAIGPLPRLKALMELSLELARQGTLTLQPALGVVGGCVAFGAFCVVVACVVVNYKDY